MENKSEFVIRAMGDANSNGTNRVRYFYKVIADGVCERIGYARRKYMTFKKPTIFKFTKEANGKSFDEETQTWIPWYKYDVQDEDSKDYGIEVEPTHFVKGVPQYY
jgi:hypothetical protein